MWIAWFWFDITVTSSLKRCDVFNKANDTMSLQMALLLIEIFLVDDKGFL